MKYNQLGNTGLFVSEICLGTMTFGGQGMFKVVGELDLKGATGLVSRALEAGVNFLDTADVYSAGNSETLTGQALKDIGVKRSDVVIATKCYGRTGGGPNDMGASRGHIMDAVARSLERLKTDHIDLYQIHGNDVVTPVEETMRALDDLTRQGMVRYVGVSNWQAWKIMKALGLSAQHGWARFETLQAYYSIAGRDLEREIVPLLQDQKVGLMVWSPLAGGLLSGKFGPGSNGPEGARRAAFDFPPVNKDRAWACIDLMREIGHAHGGASVARVALAYVLAKPFVTTVIIGAKTMEQLDDNLEAAKLTLTADELKKLDDVSALPAEYPGWMLARQSAERRPQSK
ncbi:MAG TPA: aldo/keto reductase [Rhizomicrobium sp.]|jgi:aryl-alcohol dehydrogenase-like predicted oxidoreductase|nr:aldo/keto reductase [Rhizomicrobium sp.]